MKTSKGFTPIAIVLILVGVLAVGGVAYYAGKSKNTPEINNPVIQIPKNINYRSEDKKFDINEYEDFFSEEFSKPANLDDRFRVVSVNCGVECLYLFALDKNTGKVFNLADYQDDKKVTSFKSYEIREIGAVYAILSDGSDLFFYNNSYDIFESSSTLPD